MSEPRYKAFISYSHQDERWAKWLHRALESYHVPRRLRGTKGQYGAVPPRLNPVFRDRDELTAAHNLSGEITEALERSETLIVVCSPAAARSRWVNEEIRYFQQTGRADRIYCVIVDGEPGATDPAKACFPPAITDAVGESGGEPLASDVRKWADGRHLSRLKLIAGILGIPLDQLRRREHQRKTRRRLVAAVSALAIAAILYAAFVSRQAAEQRRDSGESLVAYKLNELRNVLELEHDPEDLVRLKDWDEAELRRWEEQAATNESNLLDQALSLRDEALDLWDEGQLDEAMQAFRRSWALIALRYRKNRNERSTLFELGQAEYWIGQTFLDLGELDEAEAAFNTYTEITRRLILEEPENAEWVLEMTYALTNLGVLQQGRSDSNPDRTLQLMQSALEYNQIALVLDPESDFYRAELGQSHANLADAQLDVCDLDGALESRQASVDLELAMLADEPDSTERMILLSFTLGGHAKVQGYLGQHQMELIDLERSLQLTELVRSLDSANREAQLQQLDRQQRLSMAAWMVGDKERAWELSLSLADAWPTVIGEGESRHAFLWHSYIKFLGGHAWLAHSLGEEQISRKYYRLAFDQIETMLEDFPDDRQAGLLLSMTAFRAWESDPELLPASVDHLLPGLADPDNSIRSCDDAILAVRVAIMLGDNRGASEYADYLLNQGFGEAEFKRICTDYAICSGQ
jgi:tetratricopeptide (TPR) repeat protein